MKSLEKEELESLRELNSKVKALKEDVADIEVNISRLKNRKPGLIFELESIGAELMELQSTLQDKYGNVVIDLNTGEIKDGKH